ncbi:GNAT family N-acetyltransferase [Kitasatospora acidiphila]|uniref:GNAT family N-acetyltransferase n=1 Tax=Kitasatospora acidiphila TaxID=2567942 RepID=A0A540W1A5_9ACTN|nr:GNAT family N-acetyltransferase [Kitasatospora acidiphila]TQF02124.1 GNAT family N-acetyltransferase [Kitasatospora acidiphila]
MTTTLRPDGPEAGLPDGGRTRRWQVCVNGRPVGSVVTADSRYDSFRVGRIEALEITEGLRRGRGTVAALAAEEVLRGWGCTRVEISVPVESAGGQALAVALGYTETSHKLGKSLGELPYGRPGLTLRPIGDEEFRDWLDGINGDYHAQLVRVGMTDRQAAERVAVDDARLLPEGHRTPGMAMSRLLAHGEPVGSIWVALGDRRQPDGRPRGWVMNLEVAPNRRGHGYGRELMLAAERQCLAAGVRELGLNVYVANDVARRLYASLGFRLTKRDFAKSL